MCKYLMLKFLRFSESFAVLSLPRSAQLTNGAFLTAKEVLAGVSLPSRMVWICWSQVSKNRASSWVLTRCPLVLGRKVPLNSWQIKQAWQRKWLGFDFMIQVWFTRNRQSSGEFFLQDWFSFSLVSFSPVQHQRMMKVIKLQEVGWCLLSSFCFLSEAYHSGDRQDGLVCFLSTRNHLLQHVQMVSSWNLCSRAEKDQVICDSTVAAKHGDTAVAELLALQNKTVARNIQK